MIYVIGSDVIIIVVLCRLAVATGRFLPFANA